jgi:hypothetical protein
MRSRVVWGSTLLVLAGLSLLRPVSARADGDPASDVLFGQDVFLPLGGGVSNPVNRALVRATKTARANGGEIKIALIANAMDLGAVPGLFGRPADYARFLGTELKFVYGGRLLVVMPQGVALSQHGRLLPMAGRIKSIPLGSSPESLAEAALTVVGRLVPRAIHRARPATPKAYRARASPRVDAVRSGPTSHTQPVPLWEAAAITVPSVLALVLVGLVVVFRLQRQSAGSTRPKPVSGNERSRSRSPGGGAEQ